MNDRDNTLQALQEKIVRQHKLRSVRESLEGQKAQLQKRVWELDRARAAEQADVDRLEGRTLAAFFYAALGKKEEKLSLEQQQAYAAQVKYEAAARELESVAGDLERTEEELRSLQGCEEQFRAMADQKLSEIKAAGAPEAARILELEKQLAQNAAGQKEIGEAVQAGQAALSTVESILSSLDSAEGWGTWDLVGGGFLADVVKHERLDDAQEEIERLQVQLRRFRTELADTQIYADLQVRVDGFLLFADFFFDGLFADWAVLDHIQSSKGQISHVRRQIQDTLERLEQTAEELDGKSREIRKELDALAVSM